MRRTARRRGWCSIWSPTDRDSFLRNIALDDKAAGARAAGRSQPQAAAGDPRPLVVLDPGHGGIDTGTKAPSGELEKDIVLDFAKRLRARIEKSGKYRVLMTRTDDTFVPLAERVQHRAQRRRRAVRLDPRRFHCRTRRAMPRARPSIRCRTTASDPRSRAACRGGEPRRRHRRRRSQRTSRTTSPASCIDLAQRETKTFSVQFAHKLVGELKGSDAAAQGSDQVGGLPGVARAGRAFGAGRTRLRVEQAGPASR